MTGLRPSHLKCIFRGKRENDSPEAQCRATLSRLIHLTFEDPAQLGPDDFWENFCGGKLSIVPQENKSRPVGQKNLLYKLMTSLQGRKHDKVLVQLAGPAHLAGKPNGVLAAALMAQMEIDYAQRVTETDEPSIRCILTTDAESAFQSTSRKHCYDVLCSEPTLKEQLAPFFAHTHKGSQRVYWPEGNRLLKPSSGFTQGDVNSSKLFTCNTASLVAGLQQAGGDHATVVAIVDDITIMGTLAALVKVDEARENLQKPSNYLVNKKKQYVYTANAAHVPTIQQALPGHKVIYIGGDIGFTLSGIPLGGEQHIIAALQNNLNKTTRIIANIAKLTNVQEKLILLLQCIPGRIQHLLSAVPTHLSRDFARQHDEAIMNAVAAALDLGILTERDKLLMQRKISNHGLGLRSMESNLEFLFLAGFMKTVRSIRHAFPNFLGALECTLEADSGYGLQLVDALEHLQRLPSRKLRILLPDSLRDVMKDDYVWPHDDIQRELDHMVADAHDAHYNMERIGDQQDKATMLSTDASIFMLIPRSELLRISDEQITYLARQLFGKAQRKCVRKYCPNTAFSTGNICGAVLDSRDIHIRTCKMNNVNHQKHAALQQWFEDLCKQAHIQTTPAPPISEVSECNPTKQLAADIMLIDVSLRQPGRDGKSVAIDFSIVTPAAESYCKEAAKTPLHAAGLRETMKVNKYSQSYKDMGDVHFEPFVLESGGVFGVRAQEVFRRICDLITQSTGQSGSAIAHFWRSRLLVTLAKITFTNAQKWALAHNRLRDPDSVVTDLADYYDHDEHEVKRMLHSSGPERIYMADQEDSGRHADGNREDEGNEEEGKDADI